MKLIDETIDWLCVWIQRVESAVCAQESESGESEPVFIKIPHPRTGRFKKLPIFVHRKQDH